MCLAPVDENIAECARSRNNVMFICRAWEEGPEHFGESLVKTETEQAVYYSVPATVCPGCSRKKRILEILLRSDLMAG